MAWQRSHCKVTKSRAIDSPYHLLCCSLLLLLRLHLTRMHYMLQSNQHLCWNSWDSDSAPLYSTLWLSIFLRLLFLLFSVSFSLYIPSCSYFRSCFYFWDLSMQRCLCACSIFTFLHFNCRMVLVYSSIGCCFDKCLFSLRSTFIISFVLIVIFHRYH